MANGDFPSCVLEAPSFVEPDGAREQPAISALGFQSTPFSGGAVTWIPSRSGPSAPAVAPKADAISGADVSTPTGQAARLLLVEDNLINQKVATLMLRHMGYTADIANNGTEAVELVARHSYDLVLMDCLMPEMDGLEATRVIRSRGDYGATVPIIAMTANAFAEDRQACLAAGMSDYLAKPVREAELSAKLKQWLDRGK